jgi:hypothetical protein
MKIHWRLVLVIFAAQLVLGTQQALELVRCHMTGEECWPWFFILVVNFPVSIPVAHFSNAINEQPGFFPQVFVSLALYIFVGTLWWSFLTHSVFWINLQGKMRGVDE